MSFFNPGYSPLAKLQNNTDDTEGAALIGYEGRTVRDFLEEMAHLGSFADLQSAIDTVTSDGRRVLIVPFKGTPENITTAIDLENGLQLFGGSYTGSLAENMKYPSASSDVLIMGIEIDCPSGIAIHHNQPNSNDNKTVLSKIKSVGYAFLSNQTSDGSDGYILALNEIYSEDSDAVELNHPDENSRNFITLGNLIKAGPTGASSSSGFAVGIAGTQGHITALNHIRGSRQEALHVEDGQKRGVLIGNTGENLDEHGLLILNAKTTDGDADGVIAVGNHLEHTDPLSKAGTKGMWCVYDVNGNLDRNALVANYLKGFESGFDSGTGSRHLADNNVFEECDEAIRSGSNDVIGVNIAKDCPTLAVVGNHGKVGKIISVTQPTTVFNANHANGGILDGFHAPFLISHTGGTSQNMDLMDIPFLMDGRITARFINGSNMVVYSAHINWDGTTFTESNVVRRHVGSLSSAAFVENAGKLAFRLFSGSAFTNKTVKIDFDGFMYDYT